jgi:hypothetical protein
MNKLFLNQKLQEAEHVIAQLMAQNATLKQAYKAHTDRISFLQTYLIGLMSRNIFKRLWTARKRVR